MNVNIVYSLTYVRVHAPVQCFSVRPLDHSLPPPPVTDHRTWQGVANGIPLFQTTTMASPWSTPPLPVSSVTTGSSARSSVTAWSQMYAPLSPLPVCRSWSAKFNRLWYTRSVASHTTFYCTLYTTESKVSYVGMLFDSIKVYLYVYV